MAAVGAEYVLHRSQSQWSRMGSENGRAVWRRKEHMEQVGAPRTVCLEVCTVLCHHFASVDLD